MAASEALGPPVGNGPLRLPFTFVNRLSLGALLQCVSTRRKDRFQPCAVFDLPITISRNPEIRNILFMIQVFEMTPGGPSPGPR
jgi:hypothetical protein